MPDLDEEPNGTGPDQDAVTVTARVQATAGGGINSGRRPSMGGQYVPVMPESTSVTPHEPTLPSGKRRPVVARSSRLAVVSDAGTAGPASAPASPRVLSRGPSASQIRLAEPDRDSLPLRVSSPGRAPLPRRGVSYSGAVCDEAADRGSLKARLAPKSEGGLPVQATERGSPCSQVAPRASLSGVATAWGADRALPQKTIDDEFAEGRAAQAALHASKSLPGLKSSTAEEGVMISTGIGALFRSLFSSRQLSSRQQQAQKQAAGQGGSEWRQGGGEFGVGDEGDSVTVDEIDERRAGLPEEAFILGK